MPSPRPAAALVAAALAASVAAVVPTTTASAAAAAADPQQFFERVATYPVFQNVPAGVDPDDETVAEISTITPDAQTMIYTDAAGKRIGFIDVSDPGAPVGDGTIAVDGSPTSVAVLGDYVLVVVDDAQSFTDPSGRVDVVSLADRSIVETIELPGQPDSIAVSADEAYVAIAMENQRDEEFTPPGGEEGDLPQAPPGSVVVLDTVDVADPASWTLTDVALDADDLAGMDTPEDAEPEYVDINEQNQVAVTLQENNGVVVIDLATKAIESAWSAGTVDLQGIDDDNDKIFDFTAGFEDRPREPDAIQWVGDGLVATANEGDWKGGTRGWTVFDAATGDVVWDAGTSFEYIAVAHGLFNDDRADNKGTEPEGLAFAEYGGTPYAFVGSERSNFVAVYDMSDPSAPVFRQALPTTNGPEGLLPVPSRGLLLTSSETDDAEAGVRATVGVFEVGTAQPAFPSIASLPADGSELPIPWTALGALSAAPGDPTHLWAANDKAVATGRIYSVDVTGTPAVIDGVVEIGEGFDIEGLAARPGGGFWVGSEGATGPGNELVRVSATGAVEQRVALPTEVSSKLGAQGIEGVAVRGAGASEQVYVALQRAITGETAARIGRYDVTAGTWTWFAYPLETTTTEGDWIGLSEITMVDDDTVAVIERDKLNGPRAAIKRVYTVDIPAGTAPGSVTPVTKRLALDVLPALQASEGWTQEKLEGLTIGADGRVYAVTDNDGLDDATGETQFLRLGTATDVFASALSSTTTLAVRNGVATVTVAPATAGGTVTLLDGTTPIGTGTPNASGVASITLPRLSVGSHTLTATWTGTDRRRGSTSAPVVVVVGKVVTTTTLRARVGKKKVKLAATVTGATGGTVVFTAGGKTLGSAPVRSGVATLKVKLKKGRYSVVASYAGSTTVAGSQSAPATIKVKAKKRKKR